MTNNESMWQMMRAAIKKARAARAMAMVMRVVGNKEGKGNGNRGGRQQRGTGQQGDGNSSKGGGKPMAMVRERVMVTVMATRVAGEQRRRQ
jgi:hypothetical protein